MVMRAATATKWLWQQWHRPSNLFLSSASPPRKEPRTRERPFSPISNRSLTRFSSYCCLSPKDPNCRDIFRPYPIKSRVLLGRPNRTQSIRPETKWGNQGGNEYMKTNRKGRGKRKGHFSQRIFGSFVCFCCFLKTKKKAQKNPQTQLKMTVSIPDSIHEFLNHILSRDLINIRNQPWVTALLWDSFKFLLSPFTEAWWTTDKNSIVFWSLKYDTNAEVPLSPDRKAGSLENGIAHSLKDKEGG